MRPTDEPGFSKMLAEMRAEKDDRLRALVLGWHELAIDRCLRLHRNDMHGHLFIVEGRVLRSTAPDFVGQKFGYVCSLKWELAHVVMQDIVRVSANLEIARIANEAELCSCYGLDWPDASAKIEPSATVLANTFEEKPRHARHAIRVTTFEACR